MIFYASKSLKDEQRKYLVMEQELVVVIYAFGNLCVYFFWHEGYYEYRPYHSLIFDGKKNDSHR